MDVCRIISLSFLPTLLHPLPHFPHKIYATSFTLGFLPCSLLSVLLLLKLLYFCVYTVRATQIGDEKNSLTTISLTANYIINKFCPASVTKTLPAINLAFCCNSFLHLQRAGCKHPITSTHVFAKRCCCVY